MNALRAIDGVSPSRFQIPPGPWETVLDALCAAFVGIDRASWIDRFERGRVLAGDGVALDACSRSRAGMEIRYYREVAGELRCPGTEILLHVDADLVVVDKPHGLPVVPSGRYVRDTLLARLVRRLGNEDLVPLHRLDRLTAGVMLFSAQRSTRASYQSLFRERAIEKTYEALAPALLGITFPHVRESRLERGEPFFCMRECDGTPNSLTRIDVLERGDGLWRYALQPVTGRKHQLRVHMAALGAAIEGDPLYPERVDDRYQVEGALRLLARSLVFADPLSGLGRSFNSLRTL